MQLMLRAFLTVIGILLVSSGAQAQSCSFTVANVNFGNIDVLPGASVATTSTINVTCSGGPPTTAYVHICLNLGPGNPPTSGAGSTGAVRHMRTAAGLALDYSFYRNLGNTQPWGATTATALGTPAELDLVRPSGGSVSSSATIYATVSSSQTTAPPGAYSSVFSVTADARFDYAFRNNATPVPTCSAGGYTSVIPNFSVLATILANCLITAAPDLDFGAVGVLTAAVAGTTSVTARCTSTTTYNIGLSVGLGVGATVATRRMTGPGGATIAYSLYRPPGPPLYASVWGTTIGTNTIGGTGTGLTQTTTVYGLVPVQSTPVPGNYQDTAVVTVTY